MTRALMRPLVALAALAASAAALVGAAHAQPNVGGPPRTYQRQEVAPPVARGQRVMTGRNAVQDAIRQPRFQARALNFRVIDESGATDIGSDEVFAVFREEGANAVSTEYSVDTNDTVTFPARRSCVFSTYDADGRKNGQWACRSEGRQGPVLFRIMIYEIDPTLTPNRCFRGEPGDVGAFVCLDRPGDVLFDHTFNYDVATAVARTNNQCRCFIETARHRNDGVLDDSEYEVQVRITRVDTAPELTVDPNPPGASGPVVHRSGTLVAQADQGFEFDAGTVVAAGAADFGFSRVSLISNQFRLMPNSGARIWLGNASARGYATCYANRASANYVTTPVIVPANGTYACFVTSDGRVGEMLVASLVQMGLGGSLTVGYTTWQ